MPLVSPAEFLKTLWGEGQGFAELTAIGKGGVKSFPWGYPDCVDSLLSAAANHNKTANVYMGVCLRKDKWPRASGRIGVDNRPIIELRGTEANALSSWVVWVEFDWKTTGGEGHKGRVVDEALARKWLAEFPLKPSIIVKSGGGIQVYWLLKEAALGGDLWRVKTLNKAIVEFFTTEIDGKKYGADTQSVDLARILRIPGSINVKYTPARPCEISWWKPENRYVLDDFDFLPIGNVEKPSVAPLAEAQQAAAPGQILPPGSPRALPSIVLTADVLEFVRENVLALWIPGHKHPLALRIAGMLAHANVALESAVAVIRAVADSTNSDTAKRINDVEDTYDKYVSGGDVAGRTSLEKLIHDDWSQDAKPKALSRINAIAKKLPKPPRPPGQGGGGDGDGQGMGAEPDFRITKIIKFNSRPARWTITIVSPEGAELSATVETINLMSFKIFQGDFFEQSHCMLTEISPRRWKLMIGAVEIEERETPKESRPEGAIETAMEEFLSEARETPDVGMLTTFAGYDEKSRYFRFPAFKEYMKEQDIRIENRVVFDHIKRLGFKNCVKRFGPKEVRVWIQSQEPGNDPQSGNGHVDGPQLPTEPVAPVLGDPELVLFPEAADPMKDGDLQAAAAKNVQPAESGADDSSEAERVGDVSF